MLYNRYTSRTISHMNNTSNQIPASEFKKHFLSLVDDVKNKNNSFIITKRKIPIAKIIPLETSDNAKQKSLFGFMQGSVRINDNIINCSFEQEWETHNE